LYSPFHIVSLLYYWTCWRQSSRTSLVIIAFNVKPELVRPVQGQLRPLSNWTLWSDSES